ncbi:unnamed protein product [Alopecurus aequalis]
MFGIPYNHQFVSNIFVEEQTSVHVWRDLTAQQNVDPGEPILFGWQRGRSTTAPRPSGGICLIIDTVFGAQSLHNYKIGSVMQTVELRVGMSCQGCVGAVKRVLGKMEGVESFDVNIEEQKVTVKGNVTADAVLQTVSKTGKKTEYWEPEPASKEPAASAVSS